MVLPWAAWQKVKHSSLVLHGIWSTHCPGTQMETVLVTGSSPLISSCCTEEESLTLSSAELPAENIDILTYFGKNRGLKILCITSHYLNNSI